MPKTLITGGSGFIGLHLARMLLDRGHELTLLDTRARESDPDLDAVNSHPGVHLLHRDLADPASTDDLRADYDYIIHLAALLGVQNVRRRPFEVLTQNTAMLDPVISLAQKQEHLDRLVFASTSEAYDGTLRYFGMPIPTPESTPLTVSDLAEPRSSYMLSKIYGEALCRYSGVPFTIIRVHNAYGPRMGLSHVIPELLCRAHRQADGDRLAVYSVSHRRTFCYISDLVEMIARILECRASSGEVLNVGRESPEIAIMDLARIVLETVGRKADILPMPDTPGSTARRAPDMSRARALLGYSARVELEEGVRLTYDWYRPRVFEAYQVSGGN
jgi:nucleoside-diphosphate-sugar epimerase